MTDPLVSTLAHAERKKSAVATNAALAQESRSPPGIKCHSAQSQCTNPPKEGAVSQKLLDTSAATHEALRMFPPCKMCMQAHLIMHCPDCKA